MAERIDPRKRRRRRHTREQRQLSGGLTELHNLSAAGRTHRQMRLELLQLIRVERVDHVRPDGAMDFAHASTPNASRSPISPSRILVLTVPSGRCNSCATWLWV